MVRFEDGLGDRQAEAGAVTRLLPGGIHPIEPVEQARKMSRRNILPRVFDDQPRFAGVWPVDEHTH